MQFGPHFSQLWLDQAQLLSTDYIKMNAYFQWKQFFQFHFAPLVRANLTGLNQHLYEHNVSPWENSVMRGLNRQGQQTGIHKPLPFMKMVETMTVYSYMHYETLLTPNSADYQDQTAYLKSTLLLYSYLGLSRWNNHRRKWSSAWNAC